jgi:hypothetical protein
VAASDNFVNALTLFSRWWLLLAAGTILMRGNAALGNAGVAAPLITAGVAAGRLLVALVASAGGAVDHFRLLIVSAAVFFFRCCWNTVQLFRWLSFVTSVSNAGNRGSCRWQLPLTRWLNVYSLAGAAGVNNTGLLKQR